LLQKTNGRTGDPNNAPAGGDSIASQLNEPEAKENKPLPKKA
jgi:hypothetical protein